MGGVARSINPAFKFEDLQPPGMRFPVPQPPFPRPPVTPKMPPQPINRYTRTRVRPINQPTGPTVRPTNPAITNPNVRIGPGLPAPIQQPGGPAPILGPTPEIHKYFQNLRQYQQAEDQLNKYSNDSSRQQQEALNNPNYKTAYNAYVGNRLAQGELSRDQILNLENDFRKTYFDQLGIGNKTLQDFGAPQDFKYDPYGYSGGLPEGLEALRRDPGMLTYVPGIAGYRDAQGNFYDPKGNSMAQPDWYGKPSPSMPGGKSIGGPYSAQQTGGPFQSRPDLGPGVGFGPGLPQPQPNFQTVANTIFGGSGLPQPQLEAMPYTDSTAPMQQPGMPGGKSNPIGNFIGSTASLIPNVIGNAAAQSQDPNAQRIAPLFTGLGGVMNQTFSNMGGKSGSAPNYQQTQATQQNPNVSIGMSGGFNPAAGNTTLPGNF